MLLGQNVESFNLPQEATASPATPCKMIGNANTAKMYVCNYLHTATLLIRSSTYVDTQCGHTYQSSCGQTT